MAIHLPENIDISRKIADFKCYLNTSDRIILSARFGDGKSYFLHAFQDEPSVKNVYDFYTIYPVNYSVARNEDIFEYIKRDLIYQFNEKELLNKFDIDAFVDTISSYVNLKMLAGVLAPLIPGGDLYLKLFDKLKGKYNELKHDKDDYIQLFEEQKGSVYERDGFTALINSALDYVKHPMHGETAKKPVLVIEDLDRLDPKHLFRILNIISAHFDEQSSIGLHHKFDFDNIILVLDYETTEHIFHHFYGQQANYEGYMKKFLVREPFRYSIRELCIINVKQQLARDLGIPSIFMKMQNINKQMDLMSMRDLAKFCQFKVEYYIKNEVYQWNELTIATNLPLFRYYIYATELGLTVDQIAEDLSQVLIDSTEIVEHIKFVLPVLMIKNNNPTVYLKFRNDVFIAAGEVENGVIRQLKASKAYQWYGEPQAFTAISIKEPIRLSFDYFGAALNLSALKR